MGKLVDLTGQTFNRLEVIRRDGSDKFGNAAWLCRCSCGSVLRVATRPLTTSKTKSCGCLQKETAAKSAGRQFTTHGHTRRKRPSKAYRAWCGMIQRIEWGGYKFRHAYSGRGIKICDRWRASFANFLADVGEPPSDKHSLDRIDVNGDYEPGNCRWATASQQARNTTVNRRITHNGRTATLAEWSEMSGIGQSTIHRRLRYGWDVARALTTPVRPLKKRKTRPLEYQGVTLPLSEWSKKVGLNPDTVDSRLKRGWDVERALTTPTRAMGSDDLSRRLDIVTNHSGGI